MPRWNVNQATMNNCRHGLRGIVSVAWTWSATPLTAAQLYQDSIQMKSQGMKKALLLGGGSWIESGGRDGCRAWQVKVLAPPQAHSPSDSYRFSQWTMRYGKVATLMKKQQKYPTLKIDFPVNFHSNCINFCMKISQLLKNEEMKRNLKGADMPRVIKRQKCEGGVCHRQD